MKPSQIQQDISRLSKEDPRFPVKAYMFLLRALDYTTEKDSIPPATHVSCRDLLVGFIEFSLQEFGPMASTVMKEWGINNSYNIGEMVFNLIDAKILGKQDSDSLENFKSQLNLHAALKAPFTPKNPLRSSQK